MSAPAETKMLRLVTTPPMNKFGRIEVKLYPSDVTSGSFGSKMTAHAELRILIAQLVGAARSPSTLKWHKPAQFAISLRDNADSTLDPKIAKTSTFACFAH